RMNAGRQPEPLNGLRELCESRRHRLESVDLRRPTGEHLREVRRDEAGIGANIVHDRAVFSVQPGGAELELRLVRLAKVEWKVGEIAGVTNEVVTEPAGGDEPRDANGLKGFQPCEPHCPAEQGDVGRRGRGHVAGAAAHHLDAMGDDVGPQALPPPRTPARLPATFTSPKPSLFHCHAALPSRTGTTYAARVAA